MRRFVVGTGRSTAEQDTSFYQSLIARWPLLGWWHNLPEMWLLVDLNDTCTSSEIRDIAKTAFPSLHLMVIEISSGTWAGVGDPNETKWMDQSWK